MFTIAYVAIPHVLVAQILMLFYYRHRLNTILESDRVLVLGAGKVCPQVPLARKICLHGTLQILEFDSPKNLLAASGSSFYSLANEAGLV